VIDLGNSPLAIATTVDSATVDAPRSPTQLDPGRREAPGTGRLGDSAPRPDGIPKVQGRFGFGSDLFAEGMLWGHTLRSPHPHARITAVDIGPALRIGGVYAVLTADDVPGSPTYGLESPDQPVLARDVVRFMGEPVAVVAADHPETARRAAAAIRVTYQPLAPLVDALVAAQSSPIHPDGNVFRHLVIRHGDIHLATPPGAVTVEGTYDVGMQDQAPLGTEAGLAIPAPDGGVDLFVCTQALHNDLHQVSACLGLPPEKVRIQLAGVGGAFGAREDVSLQIHLALLALHTGRPVKMVYNREESFFGHVHRHPAHMWYRHTAAADGTLVKVEARLWFDGGAYASTSSAVVTNGSCFAAGPYRVPNAHIDGWAVRTNNPPCGAMRGFGAVQTCFGHEAQMDRLAAALGMDPITLRLRNALAPGDQLVTGQVLTGAAPVAEVIRTCAEAALPEPIRTDDPALEMLELPGGAGRTTDRQDVRRGVGFAVGFKNIGFSEGFDDYSTARVRLADGAATVTCACAEIGQGFVTLAQQITREVLGVDEVVLAPADTSIGSAGSTSASRQTWISGGAVQAAAEAVRQHLLEHVAQSRGLGPEALVLQDGRVRSRAGTAPVVDLSVAEASAGLVVEETLEYHHAPTVPLDDDGQGDAHLAFAFAAHRAVVDVDPELGLVRLVGLTTSQEVGRVLNPLQLLGQLEGGAAQGVGLAVMEEIVVDQGLMRNPSFTDYLIPTALDLPELTVAAIIEEPEPGAPFGAKGVGEPPTISSGAAVAAAIRDASGLALSRVPVRPYDIALADPPGRSDRYEPGEPSDPSQP
jgi:xanthine dehydrogenase D subunit